ncbi:hypothetical protein Tco_1380724, partial [Tanacetum coccineum]
TDIKEMDKIKAKMDKAEHKKERQSKTSSQASNWSIGSKSDTRGSKETHLEVGNYTKERPKEAQELQRCRIASLTIRVTKINPRAMIKQLMIGND